MRYPIPILILAMTGLIGCGAACSRMHSPEPIWLAGISDYQELDAHLLTSRKQILVADNVLSVYRMASVEIVVNESGNVVTARMQPTPPDLKLQADVARKLQSDATSEALSWKFKPFIRNGKPAAIRCYCGIQLLRSEDLPTIHVPFPNIQNWNSLRITLERTSCFGTCPQYTVEIHGDGLVLFTGMRGVILQSKHRNSISRGNLSNLVVAIQKADYFSLKGEYRANVSDNPTYTTSISFDDQKKSITDYDGRSVGMPHVVTELEDMIDQVSGTERWIKGNLETVPSLKSEGWDFKSRQAAETLVFAAGISTLDVIRDLIHAGNALNGTVNGAGAIARAVSRGKYDNVILLAQSGAPNFDQKYKNAALVGVSRNGRIDQIRTVLGFGADPRARDSSGTPALSAAVESGIVEAVAEILKYQLNANVPDSIGATPLHYAATCKNDGVSQTDYAQIVRVLIKAGADPNIPDESGNTALHKLQNRPQSENVARELLQSGANLNARNKDGRTPIMFTSDERVIRLLVQAGADVSIRDKEGRTVMDRAREMGDKAKIEALRAKRHTPTK